MVDDLITAGHRGLYSALTRRFTEEEEKEIPPKRPSVYAEQLDILQSYAGMILAQKKMAQRLVQSYGERIRENGLTEEKYDELDFEFHASEYTLQIAELLIEALDEERRRLGAQTLRESYQW